MVEINSRYHRSEAQQERDRVRDAALQVAGYDVLRYTQRRLLADEGAVFAQVTALLARHGWRNP